MTVVIKEVSYCWDNRPRWPWEVRVVSTQCLWIWDLHEAFLSTYIPSNNCHWPIVMQKHQDNKGLRILRMKVWVSPLGKQTSGSTCRVWGRSTTEVEERDDKYHQSLRAAATEVGTLGAFTIPLTSSRKMQPEDDYVSRWTFAPPLSRRCDVLLF